MKFNFGRKHIIRNYFFFLFNTYQTPKVQEAYFCQLDLKQHSVIREEEFLREREVKRCLRREDLKTSASLLKQRFGEYNSKGSAWLQFPQRLMYLRL